MLNVREKCALESMNYIVGRNIIFPYMICILTRVTLLPGVCLLSWDLVWFIVCAEQKQAGLG